MPEEFQRFDGEKMDVDCYVCGYCKNYFWVKTEHAAIERPKFCCWCGGEFGDHNEISGEEAKDLQA